MLIHLLVSYKKQQLRSSTEQSTILILDFENRGFVFDSFKLKTPHKVQRHSNKHKSASRKKGENSNKAAASWFKWIDLHQNTLFYHWIYSSEILQMLVKREKKTFRFM